MYILYISYMRVRCKPIIWITECVLVVSLYLSLLLQIGLGFFWSFHKGIVCIVYNTQRVIVSSFYFVYITILYIYAECWTANTFFFFILIIGFCYRLSSTAGRRTKHMTHVLRIYISRASACCVCWKRVYKRKYTHRHTYICTILVIITILIITYIQMQQEILMRENESWNT